MSHPAIADPYLAAHLHRALAAAQAAAAYLGRQFHQPHTVRRKGTIDLITEADLQSEAIILDHLGDDIPVLAEESGGSAPTDDELRWVVDPLDGTTNFAHGFPWFAVSIALVRGHQPLVGVVANVTTKEYFTCARGHGAWCNGRPIRVSTAARLADSLLATGFPYDVHQHPQPVIHTLGRVLPRVQGVRRAGAAALDLAMVAAGRLDGFWEIKLKPWDTAAGCLLVTEAGGRVTDFHGRPFSPYFSEIAASNDAIHAELLPLLR